MGFKHQENPISKRRKTDDRTEGKRKNKENEKKQNPRTGAKIRGEREKFQPPPFSRSSHLGKYSGDFEFEIENSTEKRVDEA
jgi:hypothetical protein